MVDLRRSPGSIASPAGRWIRGADYVSERYMARFALYPNRIVAANYRHWAWAVNKTRNRGHFPSRQIFLDMQHFLFSMSNQSFAIEQKGQKIPKAIGTVFMPLCICRDR